MDWCMAFVDIVPVWGEPEGYHRPVAVFVGIFPTEAAGVWAAWKYHEILYRSGWTTVGIHLEHL
jgi:hypothetical protein